LAEPPALILASGSPQRRAILEQLGIPFSVVVSGVEELEHGPPAEVAQQNAAHKASAVAALHPDALVLGVDTLVYLGGTIYGKPAGTDEARAILRALSGRRHTVVSGVCLIQDGEATAAVAGTTVSFRALDARTIEWYLASEEWRERAGGYAIQGRGAALVGSIDGDYLNVVGLPVSLLLTLAPELLGC
jgi:septum formation protein